MVAKWIAKLADGVFDRLNRKPLPGKPFDDLYHLSLTGLEAKAQAGDADALFVLGDIHDQGYCGVNANQSRALDLYRRAEALGHADAINNIGSMHEHGDAGFDVDLHAARLCYERAAELGCGAALNNLGHLYCNGTGGLKQDTRKGMRLLRQAVRRGHGDAAVTLGYRYSKGIGCRESPLRAIYWWRVAANAGEAKGLYNLGTLYYWGNIVPQDHAKGVRLFREASESGHATSLHMLGVAYEFGRAVDEDLDKALELYEEAAGRGGPDNRDDIARVIETMGERLSDADAPEARLADLRRMVFDGSRAFRVRALLSEVDRLAKEIAPDGPLPPQIEGPVALVGAYARFLAGHPDMEDFIDTTLGIDQRTPFLAPGEHCVLLCVKAQVAVPKRHWVKAIALLRQALDLSRRYPEDPGIGHAAIRSELAFCLHEAEDYQEARRINRELLSMKERGNKDATPAEPILFRTLANLAQNEFMLDNADEAVALTEQRLVMAETVQNVSMINGTLRDLGILATNLGRFQDAESHFRRRIAVAERHGSSNDIEAARADLAEFFSRIEEAPTLQ